LLGPGHLIVLLLVALLLLGAKRLPGAGRAFAHGLREAKSSIGASPDEDHQLPPDTRQ
jgi:TatA/E family protein of Tat protein translocase